ncbi:MAG: hypothetical protein GY794_06150 [bacterium]|nr:hypothetical protein [bacterium]
MKTGSPEHQVVRFQAQKEATWVPVSAIVGCSCALLVLCYSFSRPWIPWSWLFVSALCATVVYWLLYFRYPNWTSTIDTAAGTVRSRHRILGLLVRQRTMPLDEVEFVSVYNEKESWVTWLSDFFRSSQATDTGCGYELAVRSRYGDGIVLEIYPEASDALRNAMKVCELLDVPLRETTAQQLRTITNEGRNTAYIETLSRRPESTFALSGPPTETIANYEYCDSILSVHIPSQGFAWMKMLVTSICFALMCAVLGLLVIGFDSWVDFVVIGLMCLCIIGWLGRSMFQARNYEGWLSVSADEISVQIGSAAEFYELDLAVEEIGNIRLSKNVGTLEHTGFECLWLGRQALEISGEDTVRAFGSGMSRSELAWLKQLVDWVITDRSATQLQAALDVAPGVFPDSVDEDPFDSKEILPDEWGVSSLKRSVSLDTPYGWQWVVLLGLMLSGIFAVVRPDVAPEPSAPPASVVDDDFREQQDKMEENENIRRGYEAYRKRREARSQPADE